MKSLVCIFLFFVIIFAIVSVCANECFRTCVPVRVPVVYTYVHAHVPVYLCVRMHFRESSVLFLNAQQQANVITVLEGGHTHTGLIRSVWTPRVGAVPEACSSPGKPRPRTEHRVPPEVLTEPPAPPEARAMTPKHQPDPFNPEPLSSQNNALFTQIQTHSPFIKFSIMQEAFFFM